jgi:hypothetical protein
MATMYPSQYPKPPDEKDPEFVVYQILKKLPDSYVVFYSKKFKGTGSFKEESEVDYIIFDQKHSLICLEVKGGIIQYDGKEDKWTQNGKHLTLSPDRQASIATSNVLSFLGSDAKQLNVGWALGFPDCCLPDQAQLPSGLTGPVIVDQAKFNQIELAIANIGKYYEKKFNRGGIAAITAKTIINRLTKSISFIEKVGVRVARDRQQLIEVTEEQFKVLEDLEINPRMAIQGFAGTGKTVLATEFAKRVANDGEKVLFLFYNRLIANKVRRGFDRDLPILCTRFFKFAKSLIDKDSPEWWNNNKRTDDEFWEIDVPVKLLDIPVEGAEKYDAIIVDEGQDFKPEWFEFLEGLLKDTDEGRFVVFFDEKQDVFKRWKDLPWDAKGAARKLLKENCRNTKSIISFLNENNPTGMVPFRYSPEGKKVVVRSATDREEVQNRFTKDVNELLNQGLKPGQIVVLLNEAKSESPLSELHKIGRVKFESIGGHYDERSRSIQFTNINMFKGLEADVVFLLATGGHHSDELSEILYVQGSRARTLLYVYFLG